MNRKSLIQLTVVAAAFIGSGLVLYNGYFKTKTPALPVSTGAPQSGSPGVAAPMSLPGGGAAAGGQDILPNGTDLDFDKAFKKRDLNFGIVEYPKLVPNKEVGVPESELVRPPLPKEGNASGGAPLGKSK